MSRYVKETDFNISCNGINISLSDDTVVNDYSECLDAVGVEFDGESYFCAKYTEIEFQLFSMLHITEVKGKCGTPEEMVVVLYGSVVAVQENSFSAVKIMNLPAFLVKYMNVNGIVNWRDYGFRVFCFDFENLWSCYDIIVDDKRFWSLFAKYQILG